MGYGKGSDTKRFLAIVLISALLITLFSVATSIQAKEDVAVYGQQPTETTVDGEQVSLTTFQQPSQPKFTATQQFNSLSVCKCGSYSNKLFITNTGNIYDFYTIQTQSNTATTLAPISFELSPQETKEVLQYTTVPCDAEDTRSETFTVQSRYNGQQTLRQTVQPKTCQNSGVSVANPTDTICPCTPTAYRSFVVNTGAFTETYHLYLEGISEDYYRLSSYAITLLPGESKEVFAYVRQPCDIYGQFDFTLNTYAQTSGLITKYSLRQNILQACYTYDLMLSELISFDPAKPTPTTALSFTPATDYTYQLCENTANMLLVKVRNPSDVINQYNLLLDAQPFVTLATPTVALAPKQEQITQLFINPQTGDAGDYLFSIDANSARGDLHTVVPFTLQVRDCSGAQQQEQQDNTLLWLAILLGTLLLLFFILALLVILKKRRAGQQTLKQSTAKPFSETKLGQFVTTTKNKFKENKFWRWLAAIIFILAVLAFLFSWFAYPFLKENYQDYSNATKGAFEKVKNSAQENIAKINALLPWYFDLLILLLLILLCLLLFYGKPLKEWLRNKYDQYKQNRRKKGDKKFKVTQLKKETLFDKAALKRAEQRKQLWKSMGKWAGIILVILLLLSLLTTGLYFGYKQYREQQAKQPPTVVPKEKQIENAELTSLKEQLKEMQDQIDNLQGQVAVVNASQVDEDAKLRNAAQAVKEKTEQQEEQLNKLEDQLENKLKELTILIEQKSKELDNLNKQLAEQIVKDAGAEEKAENKIGELDVKISTLETELDALDNDRLDTERTLDQLNNRVKSLEGDMVKTKERLDALEKIVQTILKRLDNLEKDFKEGKQPKLGELVNQTTIVKKELDKTQQELDGQGEQGPIDYNVPENFKTILILDISVSSLAVDDGVVRFDTIREEAKKYIAGNKVTLIVVGKNAVVVRTDITGDKAKRLINYLKAGDIQTNIENSLVKAKNILGDNPGRIVVISDFIRTHGRDPYLVKKEIEAEGREVMFVNVLDIIKDRTKQQTKPVFVVENKTLPIKEMPVQKSEEKSVETAPLPEETAENATTETKVIVASEQQLEQQQQFFIEVPTNGKLVVDLNTYFKDSDGDNLTFTVSPMQNIDVLQKDSMITLLPKKNFVGEEMVVFTADDGQTGLTQSPPIKIVVKEMPGQNKNIFTNPDNIKKLLPLIITVIFVVFLYRAMKSAENDEKPKNENKKDDKEEGKEKKEE